MKTPQQELLDSMEAVAADIDRFQEHKVSLHQWAEMLWNADMLKLQIAIAREKAYAQAGYEKGYA